MSLTRFFRRAVDQTTRRSQTLGRRRRPLVEALEGRRLLATFLVTSAGDSDTGSLRQAIISSNASGGNAVNTIDFSIGSGGLQTISPRSALPAVTHPVVIDGTSQPGPGTTPRIVLDGTSAGSSASGLSLHVSGSTVKGLAIDHFAVFGVVLDGTTGDTITGDDIGVTAAGNVAAGNGANGVELRDGADGNVVQGDVISGNGAHGVEIDSDSDQNVVSGCMIGTDASGTHALANADSGVFIEQGSSGNVIGGTTPGAGNVLSGNQLRGVHIDSGSDNNVIEGNFIGTDATGTHALGNADSGVLITGGSDNNVVGGTTAAARNVISANGQWGVHISGNDNVVEGNFIGTDSSGTHLLGNSLSGVQLDAGAAGNVIGGTTAGAGNVISGNLQAGVTLDEAGAGNLIEGDVIDSNGFKQAVAGQGDGVFIDCSPSTSVIDCTIDSNRDWGILITGSSQVTLTNNTAQGNGLGSTHTS